MKKQDIIVKILTVLWVPLSNKFERIGGDKLNTWKTK